jgi:hypothetical protein
VPDFDYAARSARPLEVPRAQRIAEIRARKVADRARGEARRQQHAAGSQPGSRGARGRSDTRPGSKPQSAGAGSPSARQWRFKPRRRRSS